MAAQLKLHIRFSLHCKRLEPSKNYFQLKVYCDTLNDDGVHFITVLSVLYSHKNICIVGFNYGQLINQKLYVLCKHRTKMLHTLN